MANAKEMNSAPHEPGERNHGYYARLNRKFIFLTLICSVVPLLIMGWGINIHYAKFAKSRMMDSFQDRIENHRTIIELFLKQRLSLLQLIADTHTENYLNKTLNLAAIFEAINREHGAITDLGLINEKGRHLAYVGPYALMDKNYSEAFWFKEVMGKGVYISDMYEGYRKVPHFIMAIARFEKEKKWILRATINTEVFRSLVENVTIGKTGEVYLLNRTGIFQTSPRFGGRIMEKAEFPVGTYHQGIEIRVLEPGPGQRFPKQLVAEAWLEDPRWLLVVKQDYAEAFDAVNHANMVTLIFIHLSALTILIVSFFTARHMINVIRKRDAEADHLNQQLMQTGKLASLGKLSAGVAHEINNPLAIILTERQILLDAAEDVDNMDPEFKTQLMDSLSQVDTQIQRCKRITHNLLRFSRRTQSSIAPVDLNAFIGEIIDLMERDARTSGIKFISDFQEDLPTLSSDSSQLQQVFLNMITNAIDAHAGMPYGTIRITTRSDDEKQGINVVFADSGSGIPPEIMDKIFDPFFTTKEVGKGTGLGLSICYSIVKRLGGGISVESERGKGTSFSMFFPYEPPAALQESLGEATNDG
ncbi:ATPase/histidine kinase/DNA gyrase B/HSP90 domain protein [delta proteobacterium NaphS2]|nr:ATPase/histidine kinase/DNA gyrase B/HSP90 domain protein [delta proteobacterium NaphS2]